MQQNFVLPLVESGREAQDESAVEPARGAKKFWKSGRFKDEVVAVEIQKKGETLRLEQDEEPFNVKFEKISTLKPALGRKSGTVTAANASSMNDGAAAVILVSEEKLKHLQGPLGQDSFLC